MPYNFVADSFHTKKLRSRPSSEVRFQGVFEPPPLEGLEATYDDHLRLIGQHIVDFLLVLIEFCSLGVTAEAPLRENVGSISAISLKRGPVDPKIQVEGVAVTNRSSSHKTRLNDLAYGIKIWTDLTSHLSQCMRLTDRRTEFSSLDCVCISCSAVKI